VIDAETMESPPTAPEDVAQTAAGSPVGCTVVPSLEYALPPP
jgi:hypothetical protein